MTTCKTCIVSGHVQGVFYRSSTQEEARSLGLTGHAKNLANGDVEVLACGTPEQVDRLINWLWQGPPAAQVSGVRCQDSDCESPPSSFSTK